MMGSTHFHSCTRSEYHRLAEKGMFGEARVELLDGKVGGSGRLSPEAATSLRPTALALRSAFGGGFLSAYECQSPSQTALNRNLASP